MSGDRAEKKHCTAVILAGGSGSRMQSDVAKQFMLLGGKPLLWYSLQAVQLSEIIDDCILVAGNSGDSHGQAQRETMDYVRREIVERYGFTKVTAIVEGGSERCWSVENAMALLRGRYSESSNSIGNAESSPSGRDGYIFIHDSARPFLTEDIIRRTYEAVGQYHACVAAMPSKDTVKIADADDFASATPDRSRVWIIQTPQVFDAALITDAYHRLRQQYCLPTHRQAAESIVPESPVDHPDLPPVTDDASVVEQFTDVKVKLVEGSYRNIKITTPEDLRIAEAFLG